ncbi:MAG: alpha-L-fucosidase C-terminal domain-containing protein, partial [bacterium]
CLGWPGKELTLKAPSPNSNTVVTMLGVENPLKWDKQNGDMRIQIPALSIDEAPCRHAYVLKLTGVE